MKDISPFQFFRYFIPGGISLFFFVILSLIEGKGPLGTNVAWLYLNQLDVSSVNGLGTGLLVIVLVSIWGYFCNIIYQIVTKLPGLRINHKEILGKLEANDLIEFRDIGTVGHPVIKKPDLTISAAWSIFDSEYYRIANQINPGRKPEDLLRHEGLFDYLHGTGITLVSCIIAFAEWLSTTAISSNSENWIILGVIIFFIILIINYSFLKKICEFHVEGAFYRLIAEQANFISRTNLDSFANRGGIYLEEPTPRFKQVIFISKQHLKK